MYGSIGLEGAEFLTDDINIGSTGLMSTIIQQGS